MKIISDWNPFKDNPQDQWFLFQVQNPRELLIASLFHRPVLNRFLGLFSVQWVQTTRSVLKQANGSHLPEKTIK